MKKEHKDCIIILLCSCSLIGWSIRLRTERLGVQVPSAAPPFRTCRIYFCKFFTLADKSTDKSYFACRLVFFGRDSRLPKQFTGLFCLRQITAAFRYCNTVSQARELCRGADRNKKTAHRAIFLFGASNRTRTCDTAVNSRVLCQLSY